MLVYHVDRTGQLAAGDTLERQQVMPTSLTHVTQLMWLDRDFPDGLSAFGIGHVFQRPFVDPNCEPEIELIFELVRRLEFPSAPSRLAAAFAVDTVDDARRLLARWRGESPDAQIVELETVSERVSRHDAELLGLAGTAWDVLERARAYWRGDATAAPDWELLLEPPAIVRAVGVT